MFFSIAKAFHGEAKFKTFENVFLGPPEVGKTHLSIALSVKALAVGYSALFTTLAHLAEALETASYMLRLFPSMGAVIEGSLMRGASSTKSCWCP